ncbi:MAG: hypothetical protein GX369_06780 [Euryarchaeota archaeon]|nr:hypothetical protein [Euryarchaeota archaeon]
MSLDARRGRHLPLRYIAATVAVIVVIIIISATALPVHSLSMEERRIVPLEEGITEINLDVISIRGEVDVGFTDLYGEAVAISTQLSGSASVLAEKTPLNISVEYNSDALTGVIDVEVFVDIYAPWPYHSLKESMCEILIDRSLAANISIAVVTGGTTIRTIDGVNIMGLNIDVTSKGSTVHLNNGTTLSGDISIQSATGGSDLYWDNVTVIGDHQIVMNESTGDLSVRIYQIDDMGGNITFLSKKVGKPLLFHMELGEDTGALVNVTSFYGKVKLDYSDRFNYCVNDRIKSQYSATSWFDVELENFVGDIDVRCM